MKITLFNKEVTSDQVKLHNDLKKLSDYCTGIVYSKALEFDKNLNLTCVTEEHEKHIKEQLFQICRKHGFNAVKAALPNYGLTLQKFAQIIFTNKLTRFSSVNSEIIKMPEKDKLQKDLIMLSHSYVDAGLRKDAKEGFEYLDKKLKKLIDSHGANKISNASLDQRYHSRMQKKLDELKCIDEIDPIDLFDNSL